MNRLLASRGVLYRFTICRTAAACALPRRSFAVAPLKLKETPTGEPIRNEFRAETKRLLDIVAKSLYSDKEVFLRELISNSLDAIQKLRFLRNSGKCSTPSSQEAATPEIRIYTDSENGCLVIQDSGVGMSEAELIEYIGTIAKSGSKDFMSQEQDASDKPSDIIGQFGVGFYSAFMVADRVELFTKSQKDETKDAPAKYWTSDGLGGRYMLSDAKDVAPGTKLVLHLKPDCAEFAKPDRVETILKKYSNFVGVPVLLNDVQVNTLDPLWAKDNPSAITENEHTTFFQYLADNKYDSPRFTMFYKTDAPINLRCLLYVPGLKPSLFQTANEKDCGVALYSKRVLIMSRTDKLLPKWLRFLKGVVDSEDIPLNLSRELLQDSTLIRRLNRLITARFLKFLTQQAKDQPNKFHQFLDDFSLYLKEGIITEADQMLREEIAKILHWDSSKNVSATTDLLKYVAEMPSDQQAIYFFATPNRQLAESSPHFRAFSRKNPNTEVLFLYADYDELVLMQLGTFDKKPLRSIESSLVDDLEQQASSPEQTDSTTSPASTSLVDWAKNHLGEKVKEVKMSNRLQDHACMVSVKDAGALRHLMKTSLGDQMTNKPEQLLAMAPAIVELNSEHAVVKFLLEQHSKGEQELAKKLLNHLFDSGLAQAGLYNDSRGLAERSTDLISSILLSSHK